LSGGEREVSGAIVVKMCFFICQVKYGNDADIPWCLDYVVRKFSIADPTTSFIENFFVFFSRAARREILVVVFKLPSF